MNLLELHWLCRKESSEVCGSAPSVESKGTSHISVMDTDELMVSLTTSASFIHSDLDIKFTGFSKRTSFFKNMREGVRHGTHLNGD